jgi:hypothetical protein
MKLIATISAAIAATLLIATGPAAVAAGKTVKKAQGKHIVQCIPGRPNPYCPPHVWRPTPHPYPYWYGYKPWPYYGAYPPLYGNPYYDDDFHTANRMTCNYAKGLMERRGYRKVRATDCSGTHYGFTGLKKGHKYKITLNSYSGRYSTQHVN